MWRRYIFNVTPTGKALSTVAKDIENTWRRNKKNNKVTESKKDKNVLENTLNHIAHLKFSFAELLKLVIVFRECLAADIQEGERIHREENVILLGKHQYGIDRMRNVLRGKDKPTENIPSPQIEYVNRCKRTVKTTILKPDDQKSLSSLMISEEYSVVFCFPVSSRFTSKDLDLLETYLKYRQREDYSRVTIAFTHSERLECEEKVYLDNLPKIFKEYLQKFKNKHVFIDRSEKNNEEKVRSLIKAGVSDECKRVHVTACLLFVAAFIVL